MTKKSKTFEVTFRDNEIILTIVADDGICALFFACEEYGVGYVIDGELQNLKIDRCDSRQMNLRGTVGNEPEAPVPFRVSRYLG